MYLVEDKFSAILKEFPELMWEPRFDLPAKHNVLHRIIRTGQLPFARPRNLESEKFKIAKSNSILCLN